jgi:hypothetical protein
MKNIVRVVFVLCLAFMVSASALAQTTVPPPPRPADNGPTLASPPTALSDSGPSYDETVSYIRDKIRDAGYSTPSGTLGGVVNGGPGIGEKDTYDDAIYTFNVDACQSMTITRKVTIHIDDWSESDNSWHRKEGQMTTSITFPFKSVATSLYASHEVPAVISTHEPTIAGYTGILIADGWFALSPKLDAMKGQVQAVRLVGNPELQDWHDAVWIVPKDLGVSWVTSNNAGEETDSQSGNITKTEGVPILIIRFAKPGTGGESTHVAKAIQHLVQLCASHPEQAPKELF